MNAARLPALAVALLLAAPASSASAAEALYLGWNNCPGGLTTARVAQSPCTSDAGSQDLLCAFQVAGPVDSVLGVEVVVDLQHSDASLPDWWRADVGGCRAGAISAQFDFGPTTCANFLGNASGLLQDYTVARPHGGANQAELRAAASVLPGFGYASLDPALVYGAARIRISNTRTTTCTGCGGSACLVLNSVRIVRQPGAIGGDLLVTAPAPADGSWASWQATADCSAVPVRNTTWGHLKGLYR
jgi:hypothetical protein